MALTWPWTDCPFLPSGIGRLTTVLSFHCIPEVCSFSQMEFLEKKPTLFYMYGNFACMDAYGLPPAVSEPRSWYHIPRSWNYIMV